MGRLPPELADLDIGSTKDFKSDETLNSNVAQVGNSVIQFHSITAGSEDV
jgi:hypothetical protein